MLQGQWQRTAADYYRETCSPNLRRIGIQSDSCIFEFRSHFQDRSYTVVARGGICPRVSEEVTILTNPPTPTWIWGNGRGRQRERQGRRTAKGQGRNEVEKWKVEGRKGKGRAEGIFSLLPRWNFLATTLIFDTSIYKAQCLTTCKQ